MKPNHHVLAGVIALCLVIWGAPPHTDASSINAENLYAKFIEPGRTDPLSNTPLGQCVATSMINSFVFLKNMYPGVYSGTAITRGMDTNMNLEQARDELSGFVQCGADEESIWEGKLRWFDTYGRGTTLFHGMVNQDVSTWDGSQFLTPGEPTLEFLLTQIRNGEDVEIGFIGMGVKHVVTLTSVHIDDTNNNGLWDNIGPMPEMATIDYIDPNCVRGMNNATPGPTVAPMTFSDPSLPEGDGQLHFGWRENVGLTCTGPATDVGITFAYAESPVPEPSTYILFATGLFGIICYSWRKRKLNA